MDKIDEIAATFFWMEELAVKGETVTVKGEEISINDFETYDEARAYWQDLVKAIEQEGSPWANGRHSGDCVKKPWTCFRCVVEQYRGYARKWLVQFGGENDQDM